jgi:hypothetical protein
MPGSDVNVLSPHVSGYDAKCADLVAENPRGYRSGEPLHNVVDRARGY